MRDKIPKLEICLEYAYFLKHMSISTFINRVYIYNSKYQSVLYINSNRFLAFCSKPPIIHPADAQS